MLNGKQRRYLRGLGHHLDAIVQVGKEGVSEGIAGALATALEDHELVKIRLGEAVDRDRHEVAEELATTVEGELVQVLGRTILIYRRRRKDPKIQLPR